MSPFLLRGPDRRKGRPPAATASAGARGKPHARILLVEDDDDTRQLLAIALGGEGYEVAEAASAHEGLERLRSEPFNLVLSDYDLPGKSGAAMLKEAADAGFLRQTPTLLVTAHPEPEAIDNVEVIRKPLDLDRFLQQVRNILRAHGSVSPAPPPPSVAQPATPLELVLYTSAKSPASAKARANLEAVLKDCDGARVSLEVCDLATNPGRAEDDHVVFTPTLVKRRPPPRVWILGDLSDREILVDLLHMCGAPPAQH